MSRRKPFTVQRAEGDPRKRGVHVLDNLIASEPEAERGLPACPRHLTGRARAAWKFWSEALHLMDIDRRPDAVMLEGACVAYQRAVIADLNLLARGVVVDEFAIVKGKPVLVRTKRNPADAVSNNAWARVRAFCGEFGLSPVARTRLATEDRVRTREPRTSLLEKLRAPRPPKPDPVQ
jgi:P27 family predicted phage terminase small subunit